MAEKRVCADCGTELPAEIVEGLCPKCLLKAGLESGPGSRPGPGPDETARLHSGFVPPEPAELAKLFPQLEILELLGHGGMGAVYKARQPGLDRMVAVKILPSELGQDPAFGERFTREAQALAKLNHPNIIGVYDFGQTSAPLAPSGRGAGGEGALYYFIMEYVDGANLRQLIQKGGLKPEEALAIVPQICEALQFAHNEGIVHRDIKPENILLDKKGRVKIADFGLAKIVGQPPGGITLTGTQQVMGTLHYMAPEQMKSSHAVDHRADIYSLGVVFYEMLTGELPLGRFEPPSKKVQVDVRLDEVVLRTLESEPERRYQQVSEVKTDVETISSGLRSGVIPPPTPPHVGPADHELIDLARRQVRGPAIGLVVSGCVGPVLGMGAIVGVVINQLLGHSALGRIELTLIVSIAFWESVFGVLIIVGALKLRHLESYGFAMTSAVLAVLPIRLGAHYVLTLPMGIWALIVLARPQVKAAFARVQEESVRATMSAGKPPKGSATSLFRSVTVEGPADALIVVAGAALLTAIGVGLWLAAAPGGWDPSASRFSAQGNLQFTLLGMSITHVIYAAFIATAGMLMRRLRVRLFVVLCVVLVGLFLPATLAVNVVMEFEHIPVWPVVIAMWLGMPVAIWATVVLFRQDVREAFSQNRRRQGGRASLSPRESAHAGVGQPPMPPAPPTPPPISPADRELIESARRTSPDKDANQLDA